MEDLMKYDEDEAVKFIRSYVPENISQKYDDDDILFVIDIIWDWYEKNGYLEINADVTDEEEINISGLQKYVRKEIEKDKEIVMDPDDVDLIVEGELKYEESIEDIF